MADLKVTSALLRYRCFGVELQDEPLRSCKSGDIKLLESEAIGFPNVPKESCIANYTAYNGVPIGLDGRTRYQPKLVPVRLLQNDRCSKSIGYSTRSWKRIVSLEYYNDRIESSVAPLSPAQKAGIETKEVGAEVPNEIYRHFNL